MLSSPQSYDQDIAPERRRWVQLIADFPVLAKGINSRHLLLESAGTLPKPMTPAELAHLVGTLLCPEFAEPIMAALGPYIVQIVREVIREPQRGH